MTAHSAAMAVLSATLSITSEVEAASGCQLVRIAEWRTRPGYASPVVDGTINGVKVGVMLDTGAERTMIMRSAAQRLNLPREQIPGMKMEGIGGVSNAESARIASFGVGESVRNNWSMIVAGDRDAGQIAVLLGDDFLQGADIEFDLAHDTVRLFQPKDCKGVSLAYWTTEGAGQIKIDTGIGTRAAITFDVEVNGRRTHAELDSGSSRSSLSTAFASSLGVTPVSPGVLAAGCSLGLGGTPIPVWSASFESFKIGDELIHDPRINFSDWDKYMHGYLLFTDADMLLGADFLRSHRVLVSHGQHRMYFTHTGGTVFTFPKAPIPCNAPSRIPGGAKSTAGS